MAANHHRHDLSDRVWAVLELLLPGRKGSWGGVAEDNRRFINAVMWNLRTGAPLEGFAARLRRLEEHAPSLLPLA
jgi:transposase